MILRRLLLAVLAVAFFSAVAPRFARAQDDSSASEETKPKKKKPAKKKGFDYDRSKYKSREPSPVNHYRFNEKGDPVVEKKKEPKKKKRSEPPEEESKAEACGSEGSCLEKKTEADAL